MTDLAADVTEMAERAIRNAGAGSEGFRATATWQPAQTPLGKAAAWFLMVTLPSRLLGQQPLASISDPVICQSLPRDYEVSAVIGKMLPALRDARAEQDRRAVAGANGAAAIRGG